MLGKVRDRTARDELKDELNNLKATQQQEDAGSIHGAVFLLPSLISLRKFLWFGRSSQMPRFSYLATPITTQLGHDINSNTFV